METITRTELLEQRHFYGQLLQFEVLESPETVGELVGCDRNKA